MSKATLDSPAPVSADSERFPHHRDCINCGYDLFGQLLCGVCPECAAKVDDTARMPLWSVSQPRKLARSRAGLRLVAASFAAILCVAVAGLLLALLDVADTWEAVAGAVAVASLLVSLAGLVLLGMGAGRQTWRRWAPLTAAVALVVWVVVGEDVLEQGAMWFGISVNLTLLWLFGVSLQSLVGNVSLGVASRTARGRAVRMLRVTRLMLFSAAAVSWTAAVFMAVMAQEATLSLLGFALIAVQGVIALVAAWMLVVSIHWFRLLKLWTR